MLSACATSPTRAPERAPDPIVEHHTEVKPVCPAEVTAALPAPVADYAGAPIDVPAPYLDWLSAHLSREAMLGRRITDALGECPK
jgi:hypothetical protein